MDRNRAVSQYRHSSCDCGYCTDLDMQSEENMVDKKTVTMWITKYALTKGIFSCRGRITEHGNYFSTIGVRDSCFHIFERVGKEVFPTREEALARAEEKRQAKLRSLEKQLKKVKAMEFK